ncbi:MAG TPA: FAD-dependent oxidoreductase [Thermoleophilaceae bacterium]|nr:FAD-dependent oxidoreductase [Thermoleophilaceae bacterium]
MPDREIDFLIVGGGIAGASCAETLREEGADGSIVVVGREPDPPYHRPPLSKGYLRGEQVREDALLRPDGWWKEEDVELLARASVMKLLGASSRGCSRNTESTCSAATSSIGSRVMGSASERS